MPKAEFRMQNLECRARNFENSVNSVEKNPMDWGRWPTNDPLGGTGNSTYGEHPWHSGQFRFDAARNSGYWHSLLDAFHLLP